MRQFRSFGGIAIVAVVAVDIWYVASPIWTLRQMREAANAGDSAALAAYVDFPSLREDLKGELSAAMMAEAQKDTSGMGALGMALGMALADKMVDGMVSPAGIRVMFASAAAEGERAPSPIRAGASDVEIERNGLSSFKVHQKGETDKGAMVFRRDGLGWKLAGIDLPHEALPLAE